MLNSDLSLLNEWNWCNSLIVENTVESLVFKFLCLHPATQINLNMIAAVSKHSLDGAAEQDISPHRAHLTRMEMKTFVCMPRNVQSPSRYANNESSEVFDIIKPGRRVKIKGYMQ